MKIKKIIIKTAKSDKKEVRIKAWVTNYSLNNYSSAAPSFNVFDPYQYFMDSFVDLRSSKISYQCPACSTEFSSEIIGYDGEELNMTCVCGQNLYIMKGLNDYRRRWEMSRY